jgi:anti-sigma regulatory factor (Ser/Thr protein kinase)
MEPIRKLYEVSGDDFTHAGEASGRVKAMLRQLGYDADAARRAAIAMYEAEINMVIHANGGKISVEIFPDKIEAELADTGPGIPDVELAMQEGWSTAPDEVRSLGFGAGMGLPNIKKYTDDMQIESTVGVGTKLYLIVKVK